MTLEQGPSRQCKTANAGVWVAVGAVLLLISSVWHGIIHPQVGAAAVDSMAIIAGEATIWSVAHLFFAMASAVFAAACLAVIGAHSRLTATTLGLGGWALLAVVGLLAAILTTVEATALANAASLANLPLFETWFVLSRGFETVGILFPVGFLLLAVDDVRASRPLTPRWAAVLAIAGAVLVSAAILGASVLRIVAFGPLFTAGALPMLWFTWVGMRVAYGIGSGSARE